MGVWGRLAQQRNNMLKEILNKKSQINLKKIRRKKTSGKASDVFSSLTRVVEPEKEVEKSWKPVTNAQSSGGREVRRLAYLNRCLINGTALSEKQVRRYFKLSNRLGTDINPSIQERFNQWKINKDIKNSLKPKTVRIIKRKRAPTKYSAYIKSKLWSERKNRYFQMFGRQCYICESVYKMSLHHLYYDKKLFGSEPDEHLVGLCWSCHEDFHNKHGVEKDCRKQFAEFISVRRQELNIIK